MRIGVDVGGTNTDAVLMDGARVLAAVKRPTGEDVGVGVVAATVEVMRRAGVTADAIRNVMVGTTQFTNAFVEGRRLVEVAIIRAGLPATRSVRPMLDFSPSLSAAIGDHVYMTPGGFEFDGRLIAPLGVEQVVSAAAEIRAKGLTSAAVSCVFSPINPQMEHEIARLLHEHAPGVAVTLSSEIGRVGLIERENAAIMNASLARLSREVVSAFRRALTDLGITVPLHISQNDGTLMAADQVERYPVLTFASGPTNSIRGAAYLSGRSDAIVIDIGGTTTDVGAVAGGFPRQSSMAVDIGGVRTNFRMPDVLSVGLGGGSRVHEADGLSIGPDSVGYEITSRALVFGGDCLTATDIAVAAGYAEVGDRDRVKGLNRRLVDRAVDLIHAKLEEALDRVKTSADDVPVVLVGGGSVLVNRELRGASEVIQPEHFDVANAIGAGLAQVGGEVDRIFSYDGLGREAALDAARSEACERALAAGAAADNLQITEIEELPLGYLPAGAVRVRAKAIGELSLQ